MVCLMYWTLNRISLMVYPKVLYLQTLCSKDKLWGCLQLADIWSCGVFLYAATIGTYPFYRPQDRGNPREVQLMIQVNIPASWIRKELQLHILRSPVTKNSLFGGQKMKE